MLSNIEQLRRDIRLRARHPSSIASERSLRAGLAVGRPRQIVQASGMSLVSRAPAYVACADNKEKPMAQKNQRGNREAKKPKQNKVKVVASTSPFAAAHTNPGKSAAAVVDI